MGRLERDLWCGKTVLGGVIRGAALFLAAGSGATAQQPPPANEAPRRTAEAPRRTIEIGQPAIASQIDDRDPVVNGQRYEEFSLSLVEGDRIRIDMERVIDRSAGQQRAIDPYLMLMSPHRDEPVARNDDRASGDYDARIVYTAAETGDFVLRARGFGGTTGPYRLSVVRLAPLLEARPLEGGRATGTFSAESPVEAQGNRIFGQYEYIVQGNAGDRVSLDLDAPDLDAELELVDADGGELATSSTLFEETLRPRLFVVLQDGRPHRVRVRASLDQHGPYTLTMNRMAARVNTRDRDEFQGTRETDELTMSSPLEMVPGSTSRIAFFYRIYRLRVQANQPVVVTLESTDFDPVLDAGRDSVIGYALAASDNDGGGGFNSRLELHPVVQGTVHLRVRSRDPAVGAFTVRVLPAAQAPPPQDVVAP